MAKKKVTRKKSSASRSKGSPAKRSSEGSSRASARKAPAKKKAAVKKKAPTRKKVLGTKKTTSKKSIPKKKTPNRSSTRTPASKKAASKKQPVARKAPVKKPVPAKKKVATKPASKKTAGKKTRGSKAAKGKKSTPKHEPPPVLTLTDARAAAAKLAAMAGLPTLKQRTLPTEEIEESGPRLTKSPFNKRQLDKFRHVLIQKRAQVLGDVTDMEGEALGRNASELSSLPQHMADQGSDEYDQSLALGLAASQRSLLGEIDDAIKRIDTRTYGVCEMMGVPIRPERLEATPWARFSVEGARLADSGRISL